MSGLALLYAYVDTSIDTDRAGPGVSAPRNPADWRLNFEHMYTNLPLATLRQLCLCVNHISATIWWRA